MSMSKVNIRHWYSLKYFCGWQAFNVVTTSTNYRPRKEAGAHRSGVSMWGRAIKEWLRLRPSIIKCSKFVDQVTQSLISEPPTKLKTKIKLDAETWKFTRKSNSWKFLFWCLFTNQPCLFLFIWQNHSLRIFSNFLIYKEKLKFFIHD